MKKKGFKWVLRVAFAVVFLVSTALLATGLCRRGRTPRTPPCHTQLLAYRNPAFVPVPTAPL